MKNALPALPVLLALAVALAACRGDDPDDAPPIGQADTPAASVAATPAAPAVPAHDTLVAAPSPTRAALVAEARQRLDAAWAACGDGLGDAGTRCRDAAMLDYDAAVHAATDGAGFVDDAPRPAGVLDRHDDLAVIQVTGIRG